MAKQSAGKPIPPVPSGKKPREPIQTHLGNVSPTVNRVRNGPVTAHPGSAGSHAGK